MNSQTKARQAIAEAFLSALHEDQLPWRRCWSVTPPISFSTGRPYRGINNLMLSYIADEKRYQDPRWLTYKQAQDHGWQVRKGERSTKVEYWHYYDVKLKRNLEPQEVEAIRQLEPERMRHIRLVAGSYSVFNAAQIDGIPPLDTQPQSADMRHLLTQRNRFLENLNVNFEEFGNQAYYSVKRDMIVMPHVRHFDSSYGYMCTLLHEAGHATAHESRMNRVLSTTSAVPNAEIIGRVTYLFDDSKEYTDAAAFIACVSKELPYQSTTGFRFEVLTDDPATRKAVDDLVYDLYGENNPRSLADYEHENTPPRPLSAKFGSPDYAREELRAEIASAFTAQALYLPMDEKALADSLDQHKAYIQSWIKLLEKDPNELFAAIKDAEKISDYLLEHGKLLELAKNEAKDHVQEPPGPEEEEGLDWEL